MRLYCGILLLGITMVCGGAWLAEVNGVGGSLLALSGLITTVVLIFLFFKEDVAVEQPVSRRGEPDA